MSVMESALSYYAKKFSGYTTNTFKIQPAGKTSGITANDILTINLPSNAIVDLRSFKVFFNAGITTSQAADNNQRLPGKIDSLFSRVEVLVGGVQVSQGNSFYNVLRHLKDAVCGDKTNPVNGHPDLVRIQSHSASSPLANDHPEEFLGTDATLGSQYIATTDSPYCVLIIQLYQLLSALRRELLNMKLKMFFPQLNVCRWPMKLMIACLQI